MKNDEFVKSINGQGNEADGFTKKTVSLSPLRRGYKANGLTKNDRFIKSIKSINGQGYKADGLTKNDMIINSINGRGYKANRENKPVKRPKQ